MDTINALPEHYEDILNNTKESGFEQYSDPHLGSLLSTLAASKPGGRCLEIGTGSGLATSWLLNGMDEDSRLISVDNDPALTAIARRYLASDKRLEIIAASGEEIIDGQKPNSMDLIFADSWPGKYHHLEETLDLLKPGGLYLIDDMLPRDNWPQGHAEKAIWLLEQLEQHDELVCTRMRWASGVILCVKKS